MTRRARGRGQTQGDTDPPQPAPPRRARGRGRGQTQGDTDPPQPAPPVAAPIIAATPATVLLGASNTIQHHRRDRRLPERYRDNGDNVEIHNIDVSGDEEEEEVPPPTRVGTRPRNSPLQTTTDTARSDPLFTVGGTQQNSAVDVHELTAWISDEYRACTLCQ